jgi:hypothetical protein
VEDPREEAEAFLAAEVVFRQEAAISLEVAGVLPAVAAVSPAVVISSGAATFLEAVEPVSQAPTVFLAAVLAALPAAVVILQVGAASVPLDRIVWRTILPCSPISADRGRVAVDCHRVQPELNQAAIVHRQEEARHSCRPAIGPLATWEVGPRNFPVAIKTEPERARIEATSAIFSGFPVESALALHSLAPSRIGRINFRQIALVKINGPLLLRSNARIGALAR